ncbi:MAG TPA: GAF domain-containing protein [Chloroflexi bacterium]|nr:GAF domain-containing protein [Chloroflexota bacterium]
MQQPWDDGVSSLVMLSGEALAMHGEGLSKFKLSQFAAAALIAPIKVKDQPIGVICVARESPKPFTERQLVMLEAVADYASISLVNARLFQALEDRARMLESQIRGVAGGIRVDSDWLQEIHRSLRAARAEIHELRGRKPEAEIGGELEMVQRDLEAVIEKLSEVLKAEPQDRAAS